MAKFTLTEAKTWLHSHDVSGLMSAIQLDHSTELVDVTNLASTGGVRERLGGLKAVTCALDGYFDYDVQGSLLFDNVGVDNPERPWSVTPTDGTEGQIAFAFPAIQANINLGNAVGEAFRFSIEAEATGVNAVLARGMVVANVTSASASSNTSGVQIGAPAAGQSVYSALHVLAASGSSPTLDVVVQSDTTGFPSPTARITHTQQTAIGSEWGTPFTAGTTDDYWRVNYTIGGGTPSFDFVVVVGFG